MPKKECFNPDRLEAQLKKDADEIVLYDRIRMGSLTKAHEGSYLGRTLAQYFEILTHRAGDKAFQFSSPNPIIVDVGCGTGVALSDLREIHPESRLIGIDTLDIPNATVIRSGRAIRASDLHSQSRIEFYRDSFLNLNRRVPEGYDLLLSVGAFYDTHDPNAPVDSALKIFYDGLRPNGMGLIQGNLYPAAWSRARNCLNSLGARVRLVESDHDLMQRHGFETDGISGTIVLGPK
jgi:SAM-dependent methyltransferase